MPLDSIPVGTVIHNIELKPGKGSQMVRTAGAGAQLMAKEGAYAQVRLPSGEVRMVSVNCRATSDRSATASMRTSTSARPAANATSASVRPSAALS